jgi:hypothetical protein
MIKKREMTQERIEARKQRAKELRGKSKEELLQIYSRLQRVHGLTLKDSKQDIIWAIIDAERI